MMVVFVVAVLFWVLFCCGLWLPQWWQWWLMVFFFFFFFFFCAVGCGYHGGASGGECG